MKLQTILFPGEEICSEEALYLHRDGSFISFDGYFNLFYLEKHHKYCDISELTLELDICGVSRVLIMHDKDVIEELRIDEMPLSGVERLGGIKRSIDKKRHIQVKLPYDEYKKGVFYFKAQVEPDSSDYQIEGYYAGTAGAEAQKAETVNLAVNICTFKREKYVTRNMRSLVRWLEKRGGEDAEPCVFDHMHVFIVDNGKTLTDYKDFMEAAGKEIDRGFIRVIPNANTGGTGGFSRGMVEAIEKRKELSLTHLLMMDDDAVFDPDLFVRLYGFLSLLRDKYREITVGGALMREDYPFIQHAAGEWYEKFKVKNEHPLVDMRDYDTCTADWVTGTGKEHTLYGAWWCCCYHMNAVTKENLPLPIFVHHDDIQFGLGQTKRGIVYLNGINVWHQGFELVFPGVKQYYNMRNTLITSELYEPSFLRKAMKKWAIRRYIGMLISYRYGDCEFVYRGLMDFLKGKKWIMSSDPEAIHKKLMADYKSICPFVPIENIKGRNENEIREFGERLTPEQLRGYYTPDRFNGPISKKLTFNGWFLPADDVLKTITPLDSPWETYRHKRVLLYEPGSKKGVIMRRSNKEFFKGILRMIMMCISIDVWKASGGKW